jgi:hypothetical protein
MFGVLLLVILASIGVIVLVGKAAQGGRIPSNKLAVLLTGTIMLALLGAVLLTRGKWYFAIPVLAGAISFGLQYKKLSGLTRQNANTLASGSNMSVAEACAVLGITEDASVEDIKAAHRRLIDQLHPDKGGNDYLAAQINTARDTLLKDRA